MSHSRKLRLGGTPDDPFDDEILADPGVVNGSTGRSDDYCEAANHERVTPHRTQHATQQPRHRVAARKELTLMGVRHRALATAATALCATILPAAAANAAGVAVAGTITEAAAGTTSTPATAHTTTDNLYRIGREANRPARRTANPRPMLRWTRGSRLQGRR